MKRIILFCAFLLVVYQSRAQSDSTSYDITNQYWVDAQIPFSIGNRWDIFNHLMVQTVIPYSWNRVSAGTWFRYRPQIKIKGRVIDNSFFGGLRVFHTNNQDADNVLEIRLFQGVQIKWPNKEKFFLRHYLRCEERFQYSTADFESDYGFRGRYLTEFVYKLKGDLVSFTKGFYLPVHAEFFFTLNNSAQLNDVLRVVPGIGYELTNSWNLSGHVGYHFTRNTAKDVLESSDIVFRIRLIRKVYGSKDL